MKKTSVKRIFAGLVAGVVLLLSFSAFAFAGQPISYGMNLVTQNKDNPRVGGNSMSDNLQFSADGTKAVFHSYATDLIAGYNVSNENGQVYLYDVTSGEITLISRSKDNPSDGGDGWSGSPSINRDGTKIAFSSSATDLVEGYDPINTGTQIYLYDAVTGVMSLISHDKDDPNVGANEGWIYNPSIDAAGTKITFSSSATNLGDFNVPGGWTTQVYLYDVGTGNARLISANKDNPNDAANSSSGNSQISADGSKIVFGSGATDLVDGYNTGNTYTQIYLFDLSTSEMSLVSRNKDNPNDGGNSWSSGARINSDGAKIAFSSNATNLIDGYATDNTNSQGYLYNALTDEMILVTRDKDNPNDGGRNPLASAYIYSLDLSADGTKLVCQTSFTNLVEDFNQNNGGWQVYLFDLSADKVTLITRDKDNPNDGGNGGIIMGPPSTTISADGTMVAFTTNSTNIMEGYEPVPGQWGDYDRQIFISKTKTGAPVTTITPPDGSVVALGTKITFAVVDDQPETVTTHYVIEEGVARLADVYDPANPPVLTEEGIYEITFWSVDRFGNTEDAQTATITVEEAPPVPPGPPVVPPPPPGQTIPSTGDSTAIWSVALVAILGVVAAGGALGRKRSER